MPTDRLTRVRSDRSSVPTSSAARRISALCFDAVRRLQGYLPGQDRYSADPAASALEGRQRASIRSSGRARSSARARGARRFARMARYPRTMRALGFGGLMLRPFARDGYLRRMPGPFRNWTNIATSPGRARINVHIRSVRQAEHDRAVQNHRERKGRARRKSRRTDSISRQARAGTSPTAPHRAELASTFARELEGVGGQFLGVLTPDEVTKRIVTLAGEIGAKTVALGRRRDRHGR